MTTSPKIERAILSVSDKTGPGRICPGIGGRRRRSCTPAAAPAGTSKQAGIPVREVAAYTGFPEMMDGRLKTLHPKIHGGILARRDRPDDMAALAEQGIVPFELVVVNLYPFEQTIARDGVTVEEAIEQIDIGGPTLVRGAAKNHAFVTIACEPAQYGRILEEFRRSAGDDAGAAARAGRRGVMHTRRDTTAAIAAYFARLRC